MSDLKPKKNPAPPRVLERREARKKKETERSRTAAAAYAPLGLPVEELDAAVIDDMREGGAKALQLFGRRIRESIEGNKGSEVMRQYLREFGARLERGKSPADALDLPSSRRGSNKSQRAFERANDAALYFRLCVMRGLSEGDAKARAAEAFHLENIDRAIRNSQVQPSKTDGPDLPVNYDAATQKLIVAANVTAESGNSWDRYFAEKYPAIWLAMPLPRKPAVETDKN